MQHENPFKSVFPKPPSVPMSQAELERRQELETIITKGLKTFMEVGQALREIREKRLWRDKYHSFEVYCQETWGKSRQWASQLIVASDTAEKLSTVVDLSEIPNEWTLRPITGLSAEAQQVIMIAAASYAKSEGLELNSTIVKSTIEVYEDMALEGSVDTGDGKNTPIWAAITQAVADRKNRQLDHIRENSPWKRLETPNCEGIPSEVLPILLDALKAVSEGKRVKVLLYVEKSE